MFPHITDPEFTEMAETLEAVYRDEQRPEGVSYVDALGRGRWPTDYLTARARGASHQLALIRMKNAIRAVAGLPQEPEHPPGPTQPRTGIVHVEGPLLVDDQGPHFYLGATLFPGAAAFRDDREWIDSNAAYLRSKGVDVVRVLGVVGKDIDPDPWAAWPMDPARPDYPQTIAGLTDHLYDTYGIRTAWTIFGGIGYAPSFADQANVVQRFLEMRRGREQKIAWFELANEIWS